MSNPVAKIVDRHLKIWNTRNTADRITGIPSTYAEDVVIGEPAAWFSGFAGIECAIKAIQAQMPGMDLAVTGPIQTTGDMSTYTWIGPVTARSIPGICACIALIAHSM